MLNQENEATFSLTVKDLSLVEKLDALPAKPGVYQFKNDDGKVIYIGKAQNLRNRVRQYFHKSRVTDTRIDAMVAKIVDVELTVTDNEIEALILEANLIKQLKPRYNVVLKDDKSYPFIALTKEMYPRVFVTRRKIPGYRYFGPYTDVKAMRSALKTIRDIFLIRSCNYDLAESSISQKKFKVCLDYHIKKCEGPCEG
jgi:excinuclease ABC subunit C